jgi:hypothetical protein
MNAREKEYTEDEIEEMLNDSYPEVEVCGYTYPAGWVLKELDPTAFRCVQADMETRWVCDECGEEYDTEEEAEECCKEEEEEEGDNTPWSPHPLDHLDEH